MALNDRGDWLVASARSAFLSGERIDDGDVANDPQVALNEDGDWLVTNTRGFYLSGERMDMRSANQEGNIAVKQFVAMNEWGHWLWSTEETGAFFLGDRVVTHEELASDIALAITANRYWLVASSRGAYFGSD